METIFTTFTKYPDIFTKFTYINMSTGTEQERIMARLCLKWHSLCNYFYSYYFNYFYNIMLTYQNLGFKVYL